MLIQERPLGLRLIRQHDHGLLAGQLASCWQLGSQRLAWPTVLATALHDVVWLDQDLHPRLDPGTGRPYDFLTIPSATRRSLLEVGLTRLHAVEPELAGLVQAHHDALASTTPADPSSEAAWVAFFDHLSLFVCLTEPGGFPCIHPPWLAFPRRAPSGHVVDVRWRSEGRIALSPYPFGPRRLEVTIPFRELGRRRFETACMLQKAWDAAPDRLWHVVFEDADPRGHPRKGESSRPTGSADDS